MSELAPRQPRQPLLWPDAVLSLFDVVSEIEQPAYVVGGAVRDALLRRPLKDIDLVTPEGGQKLARRIANRVGGSYYSLDPERDVGRALVETADGLCVIDVARFRGDDLRADLLDRDFTVNALAVDLHGDLGMLIDPAGGEQDAFDKVLRLCRSGAIADDPVRALRAVRQSVLLGFRIAPEALAEARACAARLVDASPERVRDELFRLLALPRRGTPVSIQWVYRLLALPRAAAALRVADAIGLLRVVLPEVEALKSTGHWQTTLAAIDALAAIWAAISPQRSDETAARFSLGMLVMALDRYRARLQAHLTTQWPDERQHLALIAFAMVLRTTDAGSADARAAQMPLSNRERERIGLILGGVDRLPEQLTPLSLYHFWRPLGEAGVDVVLTDLALYLAASEMVNIDQDVWIRRLERARTLLEAYYERRAEVVEPPVLVDGHQLMTMLGIGPGQAVGRLLEGIREAQVTGEVRTPEEALAWARSALDRGS